MIVSNYKLADIIKQITSTAISALERLVTGGHIGLRYSPFLVTIESRHGDWTETRRPRKRVKNPDSAVNSKQQDKNANDSILIKYIYIIYKCILI